MMAPLSNRQAVIQGWEYVRLFIARNPAEHEQWVVNQISLGLAAHPGIRNGMDLDTALATLGTDGWEVVGTPGNVDQFHVVLKRAK